MAIALTINLDEHRTAAVKSYFAKFSVLPPRNIKVGSTKSISGPTSFENLLDAILAAKDEKEIVVVTHGFEDGSGLFLKLVSRNGAAAGVQTKFGALDTVMAIAARTPPKADGDENTKLETKSGEVERLIDKMKKVQAIGISAIEFRGCNLGRNVSSVASFRKFLGAKSFGAPKLHSFFGSGPAKTGSQIMSIHTKAHEGKTIVITTTIAGKTCLCCFGIGDDRKPRNGHVVADDITTLDGWIHQNFSATVSIGIETTLPTHGLWLMPRPDPNDPLALDPDPRPIFPLALDGQGKNEYALNVIYSP